MNEKETIFEMELEYNISGIEKKRYERIKEEAIEDILMQLKIIKFAFQSQNPMLLKKGLSHCSLIREMMRDLGIGYNEIGLSKKGFELLENEIAQKLPTPDIIIAGGVLLIRATTKDLTENKNPFETNLN